MNYYDVLGVNQNSGVDEINRAFRLLAKKYHPDFNNALDAKDKFILIREAYSFLKNKDNRKTYDESLNKKPESAHTYTYSKEKDNFYHEQNQYYKDQNQNYKYQNQIFKQGSIGPAGGIIFFDKGNSSNNWRYMEVSPVDIKESYGEGRAKWSLFDLTEFFYDENQVFRYRIFRTGNEIGCGKTNTEYIIEVLKRESKRINQLLTGTAAQICAQYALNGYNDWFLPSKNELNELFKCVKQFNLEGFSNLEHWSSSKIDEKAVWAQSFKDGSQTEHPHDHKKSVRAVRYF